MRRDGSDQQHSISRGMPLAGAGSGASGGQQPVEWGGSDSPSWPGSGATATGNFDLMEAAAAVRGPTGPNSPFVAGVLSGHAARDGVVSAGTGIRAKSGLEWLMPEPDPFPPQQQQQEKQQQQQQEGYQASAVLDAFDRTMGMLDGRVGSSHGSQQPLATMISSDGTRYAPIQQTGSAPVSAHKPLSPATASQRPLSSNLKVARQQLMSEVLAGMGPLASRGPLKPPGKLGSQKTSELLARHGTKKAKKQKEQLKQPIGRDFGQGGERGPLALNPSSGAGVATTGSARASPLHPELPHAQHQSRLQAARQSHPEGAVVEEEGGDFPSGTSAMLDEGGLDSSGIDEHLLQTRGHGDHPVTFLSSFAHLSGSTSGVAVPGISFGDFKNQETHKDSMWNTALKHAVRPTSLVPELQSLMTKTEVTPTDVMNAWVSDPRNLDNPYPSREVKQALSEVTNIPIQSLEVWLVNYRTRCWKNTKKPGNSCESDAGKKDSAGVAWHSDGSGDEDMRLQLMKMAKKTKPQSEGEKREDLQRSTRSIDESITMVDVAAPVGHRGLDEVMLSDGSAALALEAWPTKAKKVFRCLESFAAQSRRAAVGRLGKSQSGDVLKDHLGCTVRSSQIGDPITWPGGTPFLASLCKAIRNHSRGAWDDGPPYSAGQVDGGSAAVSGVVGEKAVSPSKKFHNADNLWRLVEEGFLFKVFDEIQKECHGETNAHSGATIIENHAAGSKDKLFREVVIIAMVVVPNTTRPEDSNHSGCGLNKGTATTNILGQAVVADGGRAVRHLLTAKDECNDEGAFLVNGSKNGLGIQMNDKVRDVHLPSMEGSASNTENKLVEDAKVYDDSEGAQRIVTESSPCLFPDVKSWVAALPKLHRLDERMLAAGKVPKATAGKDDDFGKVVAPLNETRNGIVDDTDGSGAENETQPSRDEETPSYDSWDGVLVCFPLGESRVARGRTDHVPFSTSKTSDQSLRRKYIDQVALMNLPAVPAACEGVIDQGSFKQESCAFLPLSCFRPEAPSFTPTLPSTLISERTATDERSELDESKHLTKQEQTKNGKSLLEHGKKSLKKLRDREKSKTKTSLAKSDDTVTSSTVTEVGRRSSRLRQKQEEKIEAEKVAEEHHQRTKPSLRKSKVKVTEGKGRPRHIGQKRRRFPLEIESRIYLRNKIRCCCTGQAEAHARSDGASTARKRENQGNEDEPSPERRRARRGYSSDLYYPHAPLGQIWIGTNRQKESSDDSSVTSFEANDPCSPTREKKGKALRLLRLKLQQSEKVHKWIVATGKPPLLDSEGTLLGRRWVWDEGYYTDIAETRSLEEMLEAFENNSNIVAALGSQPLSGNVFEDQGTNWSFPTDFVESSDDRAYCNCGVVHSAKDSASLVGGVFSGRARRSERSVGKSVSMSKVLAELAGGKLNPHTLISCERYSGSEELRFLAFHNPGDCGSGEFEGEIDEKMPSTPPSPGEKQYDSSSGTNGHKGNVDVGKHRALQRKLSRSGSESQEIPRANVSTSATLDSSRIQPFAIRVCPDAMFVADFHSHLCESEVIGFLGGRYVASERCIYVQAAFPCKSTARSDSGHTDVEMDPVNQIMARDAIVNHGMMVVGWYHSHPTFQPDPSVTDIENQGNYQRLFQVVKEAPTLSSPSENGDDHSVDLKGSSRREGLAQPSTKSSGDRHEKRESSLVAGSNGQAEIENDVCPFVGLIIGTYDGRNPSSRSVMRWFHVIPKEAGTTVAGGSSTRGSLSKSVSTVSASSAASRSASSNAFDRPARSSKQEVLFPMSLDVTHRKFLRSRSSSDSSMLDQARKKLTLNGVSIRREANLRTLNSLSRDIKSESVNGNAVVCQTIENTNKEKRDDDKIPPHLVSTERRCNPKTAPLVTPDDGPRRIPSESHERKNTKPSSTNTELDLPVIDERRNDCSTKKKEKNLVIQLRMPPDSLSAFAYGVHLTRPIADISDKKNPSSELTKKSEMGSDFNVAPKNGSASTIEPPCVLVSDIKVNAESHGDFEGMGTPKESVGTNTARFCRPALPLPFTKTELSILRLGDEAGITDDVRAGIIWFAVERDQINSSYDTEIKRLSSDVLLPPRTKQASPRSILELLLVPPRAHPTLLTTMNEYENGDGRGKDKNTQRHSGDLIGRSDKESHLADDDALLVHTADVMLSHYSADSNRVDLFDTWSGAGEKGLLGCTSVGGRRNFFGEGTSSGKWWEKFYFEEVMGATWSGNGGSAGSFSGGKMKRGHKLCACLLRWARRMQICQQPSNDADGDFDGLQKHLSVQSPPLFSDGDLSGLLRWDHEREETNPVADIKPGRIQYDKKFSYRPDAHIDFVAELMRLMASRWRECSIDKDKNKRKQPIDEGVPSNETFVKRKRCRPPKSASSGRGPGRPRKVVVDDDISTSSKGSFRKNKRQSHRLGS